ncbi:MAG: hypothetical protein M1472_01540, partial [Planctomycetes bacterium]|nr:hypothetical protein [Planctomycetota bacterium]
ENMVTMMQRFDLADGLSAGLISSSQFNGSAAYNTVTPLSVAWSYDANGNTTQINRYSNLAGTQLVASSAYAYNADNELTSIIDTLGTGSTQTTQTCSYSYDAGGRLTRQVTPDGTGNFTYDQDNQLISDSTGSASWSYDANGNRTGADGAASTVGADNQIISSGGYTNSYDNAGNLITQTGVMLNIVYTWNSLNLLTTVATYSPSGQLLQTVNYTYNARNQRIRQIVTDGSGTVTLNQRYIYDGDKKRNGDVASYWSARRFRPMAGHPNSEL